MRFSRETDPLLSTPSRPNPPPQDRPRLTIFRDWWAAFCRLPAYAMGCVVLGHAFPIFLVFAIVFFVWFTGGSIRKDYYDNTPTPNVDFVNQCQTPLPLPLVDIDFRKQPFRQIIRAINNSLNEELPRNERNSGFAVAIVHGPETVLSQGYGFRSWGSDSWKVMQDDTAFRVDKITQLFVAMQLLIRKDLLDDLTLDDDIRHYMPELIVRRPGYGPDYSSIPLPLKHLLGYKSWIPEVGCGDNCTKADAIKLLSSQDIVIPQCAKPAESHSGYNLIGHVLEKIGCSSGYLPLEDLMERHIFNPLDMSDTFFELDEYRKGNVADPSQKYEEFDWNKPSFGLYSSVRDMAKFLSKILTSRWGGSSFASPQTVREWFKLINVGSETSIGIPWRTSVFQETEHKYVLYTMSGERDSHYSHVIMNPKLNIGIVVFGVKYSQVSKLAMGILRQITPSIENHIDAWARARYEGEYFDGNSQSQLDLKLRDGSLWVDKFVAKGKNITKIPLPADIINTNEIVLNRKELCNSEYVENFNILFASGNGSVTCTARNTPYLVASANLTMGGSNYDKLILKKSTSDGRQLKIIDYPAGNIRLTPSK